MAIRWAIALLLMTGGYATAQTEVLRSAAGVSADRMTAIAEAQGAPQSELTATFKARLTETQTKSRGEAWFVFTAEYHDGTSDQGQRIMGKIPIASTEEAYGEERSCSVNARGEREMVFTAGLDEDNFVAFLPSAGEAKQFQFLLNKYLCRILAAPFRCDGIATPLPSAAADMRRWRIVAAGVMLRSTAGSALELTPVVVTGGTVPFDYAQCAKIAPSDGLCCVQSKTTEWHCGGTPSGPGWHQVSGECFHRETGGSCKDGSVPLSPK